MKGALDRRLHAYRDDLADQELSKKVKAKKGFSRPLIVTARLGKSKKCFHWLLQQSKIKADCTDYLGKTALMYICEDGKLQYLKKILQYDSDKIGLNSQDKDRITPLMYAFYGRNSDCIDLLLTQKNIDLSLKNKNQCNVLDVAAVLTNNRFNINKLLNDPKITVPMIAGTLLFLKEYQNPNPFCQLISCLKKNNKHKIGLLEKVLDQNYRYKDRLLDILENSLEIKNDPINLAMFYLETGNRANKVGTDPKLKKLLEYMGDKEELLIAVLKKRDYERKKLMQRLKYWMGSSDFYSLKMKAVEKLYVDNKTQLKKLLQLMPSQYDFTNPMTGRIDLQIAGRTGNQAYFLLSQLQ